MTEKRDDLPLYEQLHQTEYTCQCGHTATATLILNNAMDEANLGKQYYEVQGQCYQCHVSFGLKFDTEPFVYDENGDPYRSNITQHEMFFKFDLERAVKDYLFKIRSTASELMLLAEGSYDQLQEVINEQETTQNAA